MDQNSYHELDMQLGNAMQEVKDLEAEIAARDETIRELRSLLNRIIAVAQESYSLRAKGIGRIPRAGEKEISKEAF
jgi:hypothetical protein